jgi:predicted signal transduction protein with EAL and GGDEF domain
MRISIGISMHPAHGRTPEALMQCAEVALLDAWKTQQSIVIYSESKAGALASGWDLETQLANALEHGDLVLNYQPKLALPKLELVGVEALMRWNRPDAGNVPPEIFIDLAEMTGQIDPITRFAFQQAFKQVGEWPRSLGPVGVSVNVTPSIAGNAELVEVIKAAAGKADLKRLTVEVTEQACSRSCASSACESPSTTSAPATSRSPT